MWNLQRHGAVCVFNYFRLYRSLVNVVESCVCVFIIYTLDHTHTQRTRLTTIHNIQYAQNSMRSFRMCTTKPRAANDTRYIRTQQQHTHTYTHRNTLARESFGFRIIITCTRVQRSNRQSSLRWCCAATCEGGIRVSVVFWWNFGTCTIWYTRSSVSCARVPIATHLPPFVVRSRI